MMEGRFSGSMGCRPSGVTLPRGRAEEPQPDWSALSTISLSWFIAAMALGHPA